LDANPTTANVASKSRPSARQKDSECVDASREMMARFRKFSEASYAETARVQFGSAGTLPKWTPLWVLFRVDANHGGRLFRVAPPLIRDANTRL
jgi:hypothetical protein